MWLVVSVGKYLISNNCSIMSDLQKVWEKFVICDKGVKSYKKKS